MDGTTLDRLVQTAGGGTEFKLWGATWRGTASTCKFQHHRNATQEPKCIVRDGSSLGSRVIGSVCRQFGAPAWSLSARAFQPPLMRCHVHETLIPLRERRLGVAGSTVRNRGPHRWARWKGIDHKTYEKFLWKGLSAAARGWLRHRIGYPTGPPAACG